MACDAPCFSIVIGTFNAATTLQRTLDSVFHQSSPSWEVLVSDGASSDGMRRPWHGGTVNLIQD